MPSTATAQRADARRNVEAILQAATTLLATDPDTSVNDIARAAGVGRVTLYGHFDSRATLIGAVAARAIAQTEAALADLDLDGEPAAALGRLLEASWHLTHRFGALVVAAEHTLPTETMQRAHDEPAARVRTLIERGRTDGSFRTDQPVSWQLAVVQSMLHGASAAVHRGDIADDDAPTLVRDTTLAALAR